MLDILNNNDWKRPIYFTGGSFQDEEYIWMKDYLQLEGLVYKLVPIKTPVLKSRKSLSIRKNRLEKNAKNYKKMGLGKFSRNIYHDPETRKNSIPYRSNLVRLADKLIQEEKFEKSGRGTRHCNGKYASRVFFFYSLLILLFLRIKKLIETKSK